MNKRFPCVACYAKREVFIMTECSMCRKRGDSRAMRICGLCGQLLCDDCSERNSGLCDDCAQNDRDLW